MANNWGETFANSFSSAYEMAKKIAHEKMMDKEELEFKRWREEQLLTNGVPVYTAGDNGLEVLGTVPKGARVITPSSLQTPEQKVEGQAKATALKETQLNLSKVKRLNPIVDTIEKEWMKVNPQPGVQGRMAGIGKVITAPMQTDKNASTYITFVKGMRAQLARAMGDVGNLSEPEQRAAMELVPSVSDNLEVGKEKIKKIRAFVSNLEQGNIEAAKSIIGGSNSPDPMVQNIQKVANSMGLQGKVVSFKKKSK